MPWFLNPAAIGSLALAVVISGLGGAYFGHKSGVRSVQQQWDQEKRQIAEAVATELTRVREKETTLQAKADALRKEKDDAQRASAARYNALVASLRDRPSAAQSRSDVPTNPGAGPATEWCTGSRLYREHAEAFAREAAIAKELQIAAATCYKQYGEIQKRLQGETSEDSRQRDKQK